MIPVFMSGSYRRKGGAVQSRERAPSGDHEMLSRWFGESRRTGFQEGALCTNAAFGKFALGDTHRQRLPARALEIGRAETKHEQRVGDERDLIFRLRLDPFPSVWSSASRTSAC